MARTTSLSCACRFGTWVAKRSALPARASTADSDATIWSAFLPSGAQVALSLASGPEMAPSLPKRLCRSDTVDSTDRLVSLNALKASALPATASRPWLVSCCDSTRMSDAPVLAPDRRLPW